MADCLARRGVRGETLHWEIGRTFRKQNIEGICGFWDGSYRKGKCGVGVWAAVKQMDLN